MGRPSGKLTTGECRRLNISKLAEYGYTKQSRLGGITWGEGDEQSSISLQSHLNTTPPTLELDYKSRSWGEEEWTPYNYHISLEKRPCNFGGYRYFFRCPRCYRRSMMLYIHSGVFRCRLCFNLAYPSQNENRRGRFGAIGQMFDAHDKADKLYEGVRWQQFYNGKPTKRYRRYERLTTMYNLTAYHSLKYL